MVPWTRQIITPVTLISMVPFLAILLLGSYLSHRYNSIPRDNRDLVVHTYQVITMINDLFIVIEDAETGQRGFIITGETAYLDPYQSALQTVPHSLAVLRVLVADSPNQLDQVAALEASLDQKLEELARLSSCGVLRGSTRLGR